MNALPDDLAARVANFRLEAERLAALSADDAGRWADRAVVCAGVVIVWAEELAGDLADARRERDAMKVERDAALARRAGA